MHVATLEVMNHIHTLATPLPEAVVVTIMNGGDMASVGMQMLTVASVVMWRAALEGMEEAETSWVDNGDPARYLFRYKGVEFDVYVPRDVMGA